jgi:hypothetical protein
VTPFAGVYVPAWGETRAPVVEVAGDVWRVLAPTGRVHDVRTADVRLDYLVPLPAPVAVSHEWRATRRAAIMRAHRMGWRLTGSD